MKNKSSRKTQKNRKIFIGCNRTNKRIIHKEDKNMAKTEEKKVEAVVDGTNVEVPVKDVTETPAETKESEKAPEPEKEKGKWKKKILHGLKIAGETIVCASAVIGAGLGVKNAVDISRAKKSASTPALPGSGDQIGEAGAPSFGGNPFDGSGSPF